MQDTILIVDDEIGIQDLVSTLLQSDFRIIRAADGPEMWRVLETEKPSLILMDVMIPGENGFELARQLSVLPDFGHIPVIFLTAKTSGPDVVQGFQAGGYDYVRKPFDMRELKVRIEVALDRKKSENHMSEQAFTDYLTGLNNRRYFMDQAEKLIQHSIRTGQYLSIAVIDLDDFKRVNDRFGHLTGDQVLVQFATLLKENMRPYDLLARYGGEEFIIMFRDCVQEISVQILERIRQAVLQKVFQYAGNSSSLSFSAGVADTRNLPDRPELKGLIQRADDKLYQAKRAGGNRIMSDD